MELKGFAIENESIGLVDEDLVGSVDLVHQGKIGGITISVKGNLKFLPSINSGLDWFEKKIPGDQTFIFGILKEQVAKIKIKF